MANQLINGKCYDWSSVSIGLTGMDSIELQEISYDDEQELDPVYGKGGKIRGYGTGKKQGVKHFYKCIIPKITVSYADEGAQTVTDTLTNVIFSKRSLKAAQGDKSMKVDLDGIAVGGIKINGMNA